MRWIQKTTDQTQVEYLITGLRADPALRGVARTAHILAPLLVRRGITDLESAGIYLSPSLSHLHAPEQMMGLRAAVIAENLFLRKTARSVSGTPGEASTLDRCHTRPHGLALQVLRLA